MFFVFKQIATAARSNNQGIVKKKLGGILVQDPNIYCNCKQKKLLQLNNNRSGWLV